MAFGRSVAAAALLALAPLALLQPAPAQGARILALFHLNAKSHFVMYEPWLKALAARGHQVDVVSHFPQKTPVPNYGDLSVRGTLPDIVNNCSFALVERFDLRLFVRLFWQLNAAACDSVLGSGPAQRLLTPNEPAEGYDLVVTEVFSVDCMAAFAHKFGAPLLSVQSSAPMHWALDRVGSPDHPAYVPSYFGRFPPAGLTFLQRVENLFYGLAYRFGQWYFEAEGDEVCRRHFGPGLPPLRDIVRNTSLVLVNSHWSASGVFPRVPALVEVAGMHLRDPQPLPEDLERFLNASAAGVVYFSLGSMMRSETLPPGLLRALLAAFDALPQRVVWKTGRGAPPGLRPDKYLVAQWLPQLDLLQHRRVRAFVSHAGQLSAQEAAWAGVPVLAMPLHSDQWGTAAALQHKGVAEVIDHRTVTPEEVRAALHAVVNEPRYKERAEELSRLFRDRPQSPLETAVFWTEYVIRHRGAPHMRSAVVDLPWYQYLLLDVFAFLALVLVMVLAASWLVVRALLRMCCGRSRPPPTPKKKVKTK